MVYDLSPNIRINLKDKLKQESHGTVIEVEQDMYYCTLCDKFFQYIGRALYHLNGVDHTKKIKHLYLDSVPMVAGISYMKQVDGDIQYRK